METQGGYSGGGGGGGGGDGGGEEAGEAGGEEYNGAEHPSHAVAAQPHFATSILPARLHSHSVDPFTEGMSHMPPSFFPLSSSPLGRIPSSPSNPRTLWVSCSAPPPADPVSVSQGLFLSYRAVHPSPPFKLANVCPPPSHPSFSLFLSRSLLAHSTKVSLFLSASVARRGVVAASRGSGRGGCTFCRISESRALLICRT